MKTFNKVYVLEGDVTSSYPDAVQSFEREVVAQFPKMRVMGVHLHVVPLVMQTKLQPVAVLTLFATAIMEDAQ